MAHILLGLSLLLISYCVLILKRSKDRTLPHYDGCAPPTKYPHKDPFFGLDYTIGTHFNIPIVATHHAHHGNTFQTNSMGSVRINTCDPQNAQAIFSIHNKDWGVAPLRYPGMKPFCGKGIITADGDAWEHSRTLLKAQFRTNNIVHFHTLDLALNEFLSHIPRDGSTVDLAPLFSALFLHSATQFLLGFNALSPNRNADSLYGDIKTFIKDFHKAMFLCGIRIVLGSLMFLVPKKKLKKTFESSHRFLDFHIDEALAKRDHEKKNPSLLEGLVAQTNDRVEIRNQTLQALMASSDTISILLSNAIFLLARHPPIWKNLREEIISNIPEVPTIESLNSPGLLRNVILETLRLYPVFPVLGRVSLVDTKLPIGGGPQKNAPIFVPAGTVCIVSFFASNRSEIFGPDVEEFIPSRWDSIKPDNFEFLPFGRGPRACMGKQKAMIEASYVITKLARKFERLESRDDRPYNAEMKLTCQNANGCNIAFYEE